MADAVSSRTLYEDSLGIIMQFTNASDGVGEADVKKVDVSGLTPACGNVVINKAIFNTVGMGVIVEWDATTDVVACVLQGNGVIDYKKICGGLTNNAGAGITGDIFFTTHGHGAGDTYNIILEMAKIGSV